ncbi:DUF4157 domain-containing protein [Coleofasciculus sp. FACHB-1120]|nr:DUF4157 domain-containing protein [Coleofasciculus sp. FACHB-1120]
MPVQAKPVSASPQEQEMPSYTPLPADWVTNNNLMRSLSGAGVVQRQEESGKEELEPIQAKLTIGQPGDKYEQEADQTAQQVVNQINAPAPQQSSQAETLQREEMPEEEELQMKPASGIIQREEMPEEEELQMKPEVHRQSDGGGMNATPDLEASIQQAKGSGQPLADNIREPMEKAFGADFSGVNIHTDAHSDQLNQSIQAKAFTTGQDVFFRQGAYAPGSRGGQELIAHELTHVVQQNGGAVQRSPQPQEQHQQTSTTETLSKLTIQRANNPKPRSTKAQSKIKSKIEDAFDESNSTEFAKQAAELYADSPDYFVSLLVYKIKKHTSKGNESKLNYWYIRSPEEAKEKALVILESGVSDDPIEITAELKKVIETKDTHLAKRISAKLFAADKVGFFQFFYDSHVAAGTDTEKHNTLGYSHMHHMEMFKMGLEKANVIVTKTYANQAADLKISELVELAKKVNGEFLINNVLDSLKAGDQIIDILKSQELLAEIKKSSPDAYAAFVERTPQLKLIKYVEDQVEEKAIDSTAVDSIIQEIFNAFINNKGIDITYCTNTFDPNKDILGGGTEKSKDARKQKIDMMITMGAAAPIAPATQCHFLLNALKDLFESYPGLQAATDNSGRIKGTLLTQPLDTLPGGLIKNDFGGNVFLEDGTPTKQILFTGDDDGKDSHSWIVANNIAYDPVLGTQGAAVTASKDGEFEVLKTPKLVFKEQGVERYIVKVTPEVSKTLGITVQTPGNAYGFGTAYILTNNWQRFYPED